MAPRIHIVTPALREGDAIGNYILSLTRALEGWGMRVELYADFLGSDYPLQYRHTSEYQPTGEDILWLHYSIFSESVRLGRETTDVVLLDYHGICPPEHFHGYDAWMEEMCAKGQGALGTLPPTVTLAIAHTDFIREELLRRGFRRVFKLPLIVDTGRFTGEGDPAWEPLLKELDYLLFVGRLSPQKNLKQTLDLFADLRRRRPGVKYVVVGPQTPAPYAAELRAHTEALGIAEDVVFTGPIAEPHTLTSLFRHARFYLCLSAWESFCVPLAESLYFGTPILGWDVPPIPETMGPGGVVLEGDTAAMAAQIDALWDDRTRYAALQAAGREHVESFTDAALRGGLLGLLRELAEGM